MIRFFRQLILCFLLGLIVLPARAGEGIWIPLLLAQLNEADMQAKGLKLSAEDIYSINKSSLKDAIVRFGGGCTGSIISKDGLLLTNHHCGYGQIQYHSSVDNDLLTDGFWAMSREEELVNPGLTATFIIRIEDVTEKVLGGLDQFESESERNREMTRRMESIADEAAEGDYEAFVKPFFYGNEYYLFVTETYRDIRLVGAPPSSIGNYGQETDNWVWPRHTGDFSLFRVYTGPDGRPADYSEENIPLKPRHFLPVSLDGVEEGDFTMVFGFPGTTQEYLPSAALEQLVTVTDPIRINMREIRIRTLERYMRANDTIRIDYASKLRRVANGYKKWKGEVWGIAKTGGIARKETLEADFTKRINANPEWKAEYGDILPSFDSLYDLLAPLERDLQFFYEGGYAGIEMVQTAYRVSEAVNQAMSGADASDLESEIEALRDYGNSYFAKYRPEIDQEIMAQIIRRYGEDLPVERQPVLIQVINDNFKGDYEAWAADVFANSFLTHPVRWNTALDNFEPMEVQRDPGYQVMLNLIGDYSTEIAPQHREINSQIEELQRRYMQAQREVFSERTFYPDANSTLRLSYGKVEGMTPKDGVGYKYYTTLEGVIEKWKPGDVEFDLPARLVTLWKNQDYGRYAHAPGELRTCFIASNHTTGGNSGSPVIDGEGRLIGLNFDRNWEGTMSDVNYDVRQCRNISVDIRYVLFLIDKFAGAGYLLEEMDLRDN